MTFSDPTPIAIPEQYKLALLAVRDRMKDVQLKMLQAHCQSTDHSISVRLLAEVCGIVSAGAASTAYSNYAHWIADELKFTPQNVKSKPCWLFALAFGRPEVEKIDHEYEWIMRPEMVATLEAMRWA
jgi:hypothetical protein